jgi:RNA recognition motif-containing protein
VEVNDDDMEKAVSAMNGQKIGDREIVVNEARPKRERSDRDRGGRGGGGGFGSRY